MPDNIIHIDFCQTSEPKRLTIPWETVREFIFSFGYDPDDKEDLNEFIYQAFDIIVEDNTE